MYGEQIAFLHVPFVVESLDRAVSWGMKAKGHILIIKYRL